MCLVEVVGSFTLVALETVVESIWFAFFGLFGIVLIRRYGWEYVPLVALLAATRWYTGGGVPADGVVLVGAATVWIAARVTREPSSLE